MAKKNKAKAIAKSKSNKAGFITETRQEVRKVTWPSRKEVTASTIIILLIVFFFSMVVWIYDTVFSWGMRQFIG
jgi:preprotein translocase subunit SecE